MVHHTAFTPLHVGWFSDPAMETDETKVNGEEGERGGERMFTLKKWNAVAMWSWDVECDTCAICRVQVNLMTSFKTIVKLCPPGDGRVSEVPI